MSYYITCLEGFYYREPTPNNLKVNGSGVHFGVPFVSKNRLDLSWDKILKIDQTSNLANKTVSYGKALAGGLIFGPIGAILGGVSGTKSVERTLTIIFLDDTDNLKSVSFESKANLAIRNKIEKTMNKRFGTTDRTSP